MSETRSPTRALPLHLSDLNGLSRLAIDGVVGVTDLVEHLHAAIALPGMRSERTRGITGQVYRSVRGITRLVGGGLDLALAPLARWPNEADRPGRESLRAVLNGVLGDHLAASGNSLAIEAGLVHAGQRLQFDGGPLDLEGAKPQVVVFLHGLCMHPDQWVADPEAEVEALPQRVASHPDRSTLHLHYNTGRAIHENGRDLATALEDLHAAWPVPIERLALIGHSMGGLVARSAAHQGVIGGQAWIDRLADIVAIGSPHAGAPLERAGHRFETVLDQLPYTRPFNRLGRMRSAGIIDLRHGRITADDAPPRLPAQTRLHALAGSRSPEGHRAPSGDGLVPPESGLAVDLPLAPDRVHRQLIHDCGHLTLMNHNDVAEHVLAALED